MKKKPNSRYNGKTFPVYKQGCLNQKSIKTIFHLDFIESVTGWDDHQFKEYEPTGSSFLLFTEAFSRSLQEMIFFKILLKYDYEVCSEAEAAYRIICSAV